MYFQYQSTADQLVDGFVNVIFLLQHYMGKCATTFGNLIEIPHFAFLFCTLYCFLFPHHYFWHSSISRYLGVLWDDAWDTLCCYTVSLNPSQVHLKYESTWYHIPCLCPFSEAVCTRLPACIIDFPSCTLNDAFYLSPLGCFWSTAKCSSLTFHTI